MSEVFGFIDPRAALAVHALLSAAAMAAAIWIASFLRETHGPAGPDAPYESGVVPGLLPLGPLNAHYFLVAACFVIFDMEAAILFSWVVAVRETGLAGLLSATVFIGVLLAGLAYLWIDGALDFGPEATE